VITNIQKRIKREARVLKEILKKKKVSYVVVFSVPFVGFVASAAWIALDYFRHKKNEKKRSLSEP